MIGSLFCQEIIKVRVNLLPTRNYLRQNDGNAILYVLISFHSRDVFFTLSRLFVGPRPLLHCARLGVRFLAVYLRGFN